MPEKKSKLVEIKTKPTAASVEDFINAVPNEQKRKDSVNKLEDIDLKVLKEMIETSLKQK